MASEIDRLLSAAMDRLTAPGGPLETETVLRGGIAYAGVQTGPAQPARDVRGNLRPAWRGDVSGRWRSAAELCRNPCPRPARRRRA